MFSPRALTWLANAFSLLFADLVRVDLAVAKLTEVISIGVAGLL